MHKLTDVCVCVCVAQEVSTEGYGLFVLCAVRELLTIVDDIVYGVLFVVFCFDICFFCLNYLF